jgi:hypothetical protein
MAPPRMEAIRLLEREQKNQNSDIVPLRASFSSPPPITLNAEQIKRVGEACVVYNNIHSHCPSCKKGNRGAIACRLAYCRPCAENSNPREIKIIAIVNELEHTTITAPRGIQLPKTEEDPQTYPYIGNNEVLRLNNQLFRLSSPGFDDRLIEYPIPRHFVHTNTNTMSNMSEERQTALSLSLLERLYARLAVYSEAISLAVVNIPANCTLEQLKNIVDSMLRALLFSQRESSDASLDDPDVLAAIEHIFSSDERLNNFLDYLSLQNALIGETNLPISAYVGSNFNAQPLVSQEAAMAAIFYIIDYVTKDSMNPADLLGFIQAARLRFQTFRGQAPEGESTEENNRPARRLFQIIQNGIAGAVEISVQQCVLNIAGLPSHDSTELYTFIFTKSAIVSVRLSVANHISRINGIDVDQRSAVEQDPINPQSVRRRRRQTIDETARPERVQSQLSVQTIDPFAAIDFEYENELPTVGTTHRNRENILVNTSQDLEYLHRGDALAFFSLTEYACFVSRIAIERNDDENQNQLENEHTPRQRGRLENAKYRFAPGYPLRDVFEQRIKSKQSIPVYGGISSVPTWPNFKTVATSMYATTDDENTFEQDENTFAEYILVMFRPWPAPDQVHANFRETFVQQLDTFLNLLIEGLHLQNVLDQSYQAPVGFVSTILRDTLESRAYCFNQKCTARFIGKPHFYYIIQYAREMY